VPLTSLGGQATGVVGGDLHSRALLHHSVPLRTYRFDNRSARRGTEIVRGTTFAYQTLVGVDSRLN